MISPNIISKKEVLQDHSPLIHRVVTHSAKPDSVPELEEILQLAETNDWGKLVETIRTIMVGNHDRSLLQDLDEEETIIIEAILNGIEDPNTLPPISADLKSDMAAPGIASLIHASIQGSVDSQNIITELTQKMLSAGGDFAIMAGRIRLMLEGERDLGTSIEDISEQRQTLMTDILSELTKLETE